MHSRAPFPLLLILFLFVISPLQAEESVPKAIINTTQDNALKDKDKALTKDSNIAEAEGTTTVVTSPNLTINNADTVKPKAPQKQVDSKPQKLATIDVTGVDEELAKNIELHMPVTIPECNAERGDIKQFFNTVKKHLRKASRALGYYDAEFKSGGKIVDGCWKLKLRINQGLPVKVISQKISVVGEGANLPGYKRIMEKLPYENGDVLNHKLYTEFKTSLTDAAQALGFFDAEFEQHSIRVDPLGRKATIDLKFNTGLRYRYGEVTIKQDVLSEGTIDTYLLLKTGKPFYAEDLLQQQQLLQRSNYFKTIKISVLHEQASNGRVPVLIELIRKKRNAYKFKLGYGSETGPRVSAEMNRRWTGDEGKALKILGRVSKNDQLISLNLLNPQEKPEDDSLVYNIDIKREVKPDSVSRSFKIGEIFTRKRDSGWVQKASLGLLLDFTKPTGEDEFFSRYLLFGVGLEKTSADGLLFPLNGWRMKYEANVASKAVLSDQDIIQLKISGKRIKTIGEGRFVGRFDLGSTLVNNYSDLPQGLRFYSGGQNSVRGYVYSSLGDIEHKDTNGDGKLNEVNVGGRNLLNLSLEYQYPVVDEWSAALFVDTGNAFDDWADYEMKVGVGFGARWKSPIGPVRIDLGFPTDDFKKPRLYLGIGSDL